MIKMIKLNGIRFADCVRNQSSPGQIRNGHVPRPRAALSTGDHQHPKDRKTGMNFRYGDDEGGPAPHTSSVCVREANLDDIPNRETTARRHQSRHSEISKGALVLFCVPLPKRREWILQRIAFPRQLGWCPGDDDPPILDRTGKLIAFPYAERGAHSR
jgi:hypothetical protein